MHTATNISQKTEKCDKSREKGCKFAEIETEQAYIEIVRSGPQEVLTIPPQTIAILPPLNVNLKQLHCKNGKGSKGNKSIQLAADISVTNETSDISRGHRLLFDILCDGLSIVKGPQVLTDSLIGGSRTLNFGLIDELTNDIDKSRATATYQVVLHNEYVTPVQIKFYCLTAKLPTSKKETFYVNQKFISLSSIDTITGSDGALILPADGIAKSIVVVVPKLKSRCNKLLQVKLNALFSVGFDGASFPDITYDILRDGKSLTCGPQSVLQRSPPVGDKKVATPSTLLGGIFDEFPVVFPVLRPIAQLDSDLDFYLDLVEGDFAEREGKGLVGALSVKPASATTSLVPNLTGVHNFAQNIVDDTLADELVKFKDEHEVCYELRLVNKGSGTPAKLDFYSFSADVITPRKHAPACVNFSALQLFSDTKEGVKRLRPGNSETYSIPVKIDPTKLADATTVKLTADLNAAFHFTTVSDVDQAITESGKFYFEILRVPNCGNESKTVSLTKGRQLIFGTPDVLVSNNLVGPPTLGTPANFNCIFLGICPNGPPRSGVVASIAPSQTPEDVLVIDLNSQVSVVDKVDVLGKYTYQIILTNASNFDAVINNLVFVAEL